MFLVLDDDNMWLTDEDDTYAEGEIKSQTQATEISEGKWKSILRHKVLDVVDRTNENRKPIGRRNVKLYTEEWNVAYPNMTSRLPRLEWRDVYQHRQNSVSKSVVPKCQRKFCWSREMMTIVS